MQKAIIFVRVSTERQDLSEQELALVQLAERDGYAQSQQILISYKESAIRLSEEARLGCLLGDKYCDRFLDIRLL